MPSKRSACWGARGASCFLFVGAACGGAPAPRAAEAAPELVSTASSPSPTEQQPPSAAGPASAPPSAPPPSGDASPASPSAAGDTSLPLAVYRAAGVPEVDQPWSVADYERCLQVLVDLLRSGRADLPRHGSARSGALFARLVDARNFAATPGLTTGEHARRLQGYLAVFPGLLKVYSPASDGIDFSVEQAELIVALLELLKSALEASRPWSVQDARWVEVYDVQKQMTLGVARGARAMLDEPQRYSPAIRERLQAELTRRAPELERHLTTEDAREVHAIAHPKGNAQSDARAPDSEPLR